MTRPAADFGPSIVVVTYNSASVLPELLDCLPAGLEMVEEFETIGVDNGKKTKKSRARIA